MIEVNNFDVIKPLLDFDSNGRSVILVWVVRRHKDGNEDAVGQNKNRTIKSYHFQSMEQLDKRTDEIIKLCREFNCRAYICVNPKPILNVLFSLQSIVMENIKTQINCGNSMLLKGMIDSAVMKSGTKGDKLWVVDIDTKDEEAAATIADVVIEARSGYGNNIVKIIDTAHGYHLITHPFDTRSLAGYNAEVKRDGLTLLYAYLEE